MQYVFTDVSTSGTEAEEIEEIEESLSGLWARPVSSISETSVSSVELAVFLSSCSNVAFLGKKSRSYGITKAGINPAAPFCNENVATRLTAISLQIFLKNDHF